ncbi:MAG TPA: S8 family serine peptidase [Xanthomonadaceae bacterium]|nr:S8 family serine peptidase [Xanthomonadaceae bacterium]
MSATRSKPEVQSDLLDLLGSGKPAQFAIFLERPDLSAAFGMDWSARGRYVHETLTEAAERLQAPLRDHLRSSGYQFQQFWVDNIIVVDNGDMRLLEDLSLFEGVKAARILPEVHLIEPEPVQTTGTTPPGPIPNLVRIKAPEAWAMGATGQGMVVASIDTGVRFTHEALQSKYRGHLGGGSFDHNYNFFNPYGATIGDSDNHGSHVTGTMVGGTAGETIGVAPDAQWIACRGFDPGATQAGLIACGQWVAAPTDLSGANPDPDLRPHAVNNSWGNCEQSYNPWYQGVVDTWIAAGIVPMFANGNASNCGYSSPPGLNTVGNPGRYGAVLGIGSTGNSNGQYANHSNWGPTDNPSPGLPTHPDHFGFPNIKPNVVAPGVSIRSATRASDTSYGNFTGTSMSSPHATGLVAVMWSAAPCLIGDYAQTGTIMIETAVPIPYDSGGSPPPGPGNVPNYATGFGEIDAEAAVTAAVGACGPQGAIAGTVTDSGSSDPIEGVTVTILNPTPPPPNYVTSTNVNGEYLRSVNVGDGFTVSFSRYGYLPGQVTDVDVVENVTTTVDIALDPAPVVSVSGTVTDADTGWGLHARIEIGGFPGDPIWTDPVSGAYSIDLVAGTEYTFSVSTEIPGYEPTSRSVGPLSLFGGPVVEDFELDASDDCTAPGRSSSVGINEHFEGSFPPAGWSVSSLGGAAACVWRRNDQLVNQAGNPATARTNFAGGDGFSAAADSDRCGSGSSMHTDLRTPILDLTGFDAPVLEYVVSYRHLGSSRLFTEISTNGGTDWTVLEELSADLSAQGPGTPRSFDLTPFAASSDVQIRFRYNAPGWDWWGQVDQVRVRSTVCTVPDGGLIVGTVSDENTGGRLTGAMVSTDAGALASYDSADTAVGAGFYAVYAALGSDTVAADGSPIHPGYGIGSASIVPQVPAGELSVSPSSVVKEVELNSTDSEDLLLTNNGGMPVTVALSIDSTPPEHFEGAFPPAGWTVSDGAGATPNCGWRRNDQWGLANFAGGEGLAAAVDSDACGSGTQTRAFLTSPVFNLSASTSVQLNFVLSYRHLGGPNNFLRLEVSNNGGSSWTTVETYVASVSATGPGTPQSFNLGAQLAGSSQAQFRFFYSGDWAWWAVVDQLHLVADVPWLDVDPSGGVFVSPMGGGSLQADLLFDAGAVPGVGSYSAFVVIEHDTPYSVAAVPVTMNVTAPATFGQLEGTVTGLGYCDTNPAPLAGAQVTVTSSADTYDLVTNGDGYYSLFLDAAEGPVDISVAAPQHQPAEREAVVISAGDVSTEDFDLRLEASCASVTPTSLSATLSQGGSDSQTLTLHNDGGAELNWEVAFEPSAASKVSLDGSAKPSDAAVRVAPQSSWKSSALAQAGNAGQVQGIPNAGPAGNAVALVLDDGTHENAIGLTNGGQFVWFNRFTPDAETFPFSLEELWIIFREGTGINVGELVDLYVFTDADGDPDTGGTHVASYLNVAVGAVDGTTWTVVDLDPPLPLTDAGDVWIVAVNRTAGVAAGTFVAAIDQTPPSAVRSWIGFYGGPVPNPPTFPATELWGTIDSFGLAGNWMLRGYGVGACADALPGWLSAAPSSGTVGVDDSQDIDVGFDASGLEPGVYEGNLCVLTDDANAPQIQVPVTLTVTGELPEDIFADGFESP